MSTSCPERKRKKTTVLGAFETRFSKRDYAGETHLVTEPHSAERRYPSGSTRADRDPASDAQVRAGDHPSRKGLGDRAESLLAYRERLSGLPGRAQSAWVWINGGRAMSSPVVRSKNVIKRNSMRVGVALLLALAIFVAVPNATQAAAAQRHDQVPGFYRLKVGDLEVTALFVAPA